MNKKDLINNNKEIKKLINRVFITRVTGISPVSLNYKASLENPIKNINKATMDYAASPAGRAAYAARWKKSNSNAGLIGGIVSGVSGLATNFLNASELQNTEQADNAIEAVNSFQPNTSSLDAIVSSYNNAPNAYTDWEGSDFTKSTGEQLINLGKSGLEGFASGMQTGNVWAGVGMAAANMLSSGIGWAVGDSKAKRFAENANIEAEIANTSKDMKAEDAIKTYQQQEMNNFLTGVKAYGGPLFNYSGDSTNGLTFINEGGTHEQNPFEGVPMGVDNQGTPNLVEEGEIIYNDYVFSNRLKPTKKQLEDNGLNKKYNGWTFAKIVEDLQKESANNPNDAISQNTLKDMMNIVTIMQEEVRAKKQAKENNMFDLGGWATQLGMATPIISNFGKAIYNAAKPIDYSNVVAEQAMRGIPTMTLPKVGGKINYKGIDKESFITPIVNTGRANARLIQDLGVTGSDVLNRTMVSNYGINNAIAKAAIAADQQDLANRLQVGQLNLGIDTTNLNSTQAEQMANIAKGERIAQGIISDAQMREQLAALKADAVDKTLTAGTQGVSDLIRQNVEWNWIKNNPEYLPYFNRGKKYGGMLTKKRK